MLRHRRDLARRARGDVGLLDRVARLAEQARADLDRVGRIRHDAPRDGLAVLELDVRVLVLVAHGLARIDERRRHVLRREASRHRGELGATAAADAADAVALRALRCAVGAETLVVVAAGDELGRERRELRHRPRVARAARRDDRVVLVALARRGRGELLALAFGRVRDELLGHVVEEARERVAAAALADARDRARETLAEVGIPAVLRIAHGVDHADLLRGGCVGDDVGDGLAVGSAAREERRVDLGRRAHVVLLQDRDADLHGLGRTDLGEDRRAVHVEFIRIGVGALGGEVHEQRLAHLVEAGHLRVDLAAAEIPQLAGAEPFLLERRVAHRGRERDQALRERRAVDGRFTRARERDEREDRGLRILLGERACAPQRRILVFDRDARGAAHAGVLRSERGKRTRDRGGRGVAREALVELLDLAALGERGGHGHRRALDRDGILGAHAVDRARQVAAADAEVHRAIHHHRIGERQRTTREERLDAQLRRRRVLRVVGRPAGPHRAVGPVEEEHALVPRRGELQALRREHAGRRRGADIDRGGHRVGAPRGPLAAARAPAVVDAAREFAHTRRAVPREAHVPLHVAVVGERAADLVEREVVAVAEARGHEFPLRAFAIGAHDPSARRHHADGVAVRIPQAREDDVLLPDLGQARVLERLLRRRAVVAADDPDRAIGRKHDLVRPVLAAIARDRGEHLLVVVGAVVVRVAQAPHAARLRRAFIHDREEIVVDREKSVRAADLGLDELDRRRRGVDAVGARLDGKRAAVLRAHDDALTAHIGRHRDDRATRLGRDVHELADESRRHGDRAVDVAGDGRGAERRGHSIAPRRVAELGHHDRGRTRAGRAARRLP